MSGAGVVLQARGLCKHFGGVRAVDDLGFELHAGEMLALIGPNGAGKSTSFQLLNGQLRPDAGSVRLQGRELVGLSAREVARLGVGRTFQVAQSFASMRVVENVQMALLVAQGAHWQFWRRAAMQQREEAMQLLSDLGLERQAERASSELAYGDVKRLELALALAARPRVLLMDEPTAGMAPAERHALMALTQRLVAERGMSVLFTEHSMDVVFAHAQRVLVMAQGRLIAQGAPEAVRADARVQAVYLGGGLPASVSDGADASEVQPRRVAPQDSAPAVPALQVRSLAAGYGAAQVLLGVDLTLRQGEVLALMGRNGAGKSTTLKAIMGLLPRHAGSVALLGRDLDGAAAHEVARAGLGYVPEERRIFTELSVRQNLDVGRQAARAWPDGRPLPPWTAEALFELFPNLAAMPDRAGGHMSGGEQQMLTVARTLMGNPYVLLLDEPSEGVAPVIVERMAQAVRSLKAQGVAVLLCEQNLAFAQAVSDRVAVLDRGRICFEGAMQELMAREDLRRAHLGV